LYVVQMEIVLLSWVDVSSAATQKSLWHYHHLLFSPSSYTVITDVPSLAPAAGLTMSPNGCNAKQTRLKGAEYKYLSASAQSGTTVEMP